MTVESLNILRWTSQEHVVVVEVRQGVWVRGINGTLVNRTGDTQSHGVSGYGRPRNASDNKTYTSNEMCEN